MRRTAAILSIAALATATTDGSKGHASQEPAAKEWDSVALVQSERRSRRNQDESNLQGEQETTVTAGLQRMLDHEDVEESIAKHAHAFPSSEQALQDTEKAMNEFMADAAKERQKGKIPRQKNSPMLDPLEDTDLVSMLTELKAALKEGKLTPSHAEATSMLETAIQHQAPGLEIPREALEERVRRWRAATEVWRDDESIHEQVLTAARKMYAMRSQTDLFEPLQDDNATALLQLGHGMPRLAQRAATAFQRMGLAGDEQVEKSEENEPKKGPWTPPPGVWDPYMRLASHWGPRWDAKCKVGMRFTLTGGFKNHFYLSQVKAEGLGGAFSWMKYVLRVGVYWRTATGWFWGFQFQIDWELFDPDRVQKGVGSQITPKQIGVTVRLSESTKPKPEELLCKDKGYKLINHGTIQLSPPALQRNFASDNVKKTGFKDGFLDGLVIMDYKGGRPTVDNKTVDGWTTALGWRLGFDSEGIAKSFFNKAFLFHKMRIWPKAARRLIDFRIRAFSKPPTKDSMFSSPKEIASSVSSWYAPFVPRK